MGVQTKQTDFGTIDFSLEIPSDPSLVSHVTHFYKDRIPMRDPISIRLGPGMSIFQYWQYEWAREFRMIQSMHTLSMRQFLKGKQR